MGVSQSVYVGAYYKVWPGEEKYQSRTGLCPECARYFAATFCPDHGEALIFKAAVRKRDVIELIEERFEEEEYTRLGEGDGWDFDVVIRQDWDDKGAMGEFVETDGDDVLYDMPSLYDFGGDPLVAYLTEKDIRHETCYGIVVTWG